MDLKSIARNLAASEAKTRSEGFNQVRSFLSSKSLTFSDYQKLWKGLFYCNPHLDLWMADKDHSEVATNLALLSSISKSTWEWLLAFFETMRNEWDQIDAIRIDKFMFLVRLMIKNALNEALIDEGEWLKILFNIIEKSSYKGSGLLFHIADVYIDEIPNITLKNKLSLINPFIELMKTSKLNQIVDMVYTRILLKLAENRENGLSDWAYSNATTK